MRAIAPLFILLLAACSAGPTNLNPKADAPLRPVETVDLERYSGTWYVIANIPYFFERGNVAAKATYRPRDDGKMDDIYLYRDGDFNAPEERMEGVAWVVDESSNAIWEVQFIWPFTFDYYILYLDDDYQHVAVGHPDKELAWIMSRQPRMPETAYDKAMVALWEQGYDVTQLRKVPQFPEDMGQPGYQ
jgi:apolipoprotein D and lipocalin family protein